jgi:phage shock protein C
VNSRRLYRCRHDRQLAGVASGMAEYLDLDPTVVRVLWILSVFLGGFTILLYVILAFVMPLEPAVSVDGAGAIAATGDTADTGPTAGDATAAATSAWSVPSNAGPAHQHRQRGEGRLGLAAGVLLVVFGSIALVGAALPGWVAGIALGPTLLIALGVALVVVAIRRPSTES